MKYREGLIIGSGCEAGELYKAMVKGSPYNEVREIAQFYDFLEVQPIDNNAYLVREGYVEGRKALEKINKSIVKLGKKIGKPVVATGDVHFLDPQDEYFRRILMSGQGYRDADQQPPLYFKTTRDMLDDFKYLEQETAMEIVIHNPRLIADSVEEIQPIPSGLFTPEIPGRKNRLAKCPGERLQDIRRPTSGYSSKAFGERIERYYKHGFMFYTLYHINW